MLRNKKVIIDNEVIKLYIPELELKSKSFKIIFNFNIVDNE